MGGWPVWLASASLRDPYGRVRPAKDWDEDTTASVSEGLDAILSGVGDPDHEREFVMCVTLCRHRALTDDEYARLPGWWHEADAVDIAGGPVRVRWTKGVPRTPATEPCEHPGKAPLSGSLWLPVDCGTCPSCIARATCRTRAGADVVRPW